MMSHNRQLKKDCDAVIADMLACYGGIATNCDGVCLMGWSLGQYIPMTKFFLQNVLPGVAT
tara:strand:+ start:7150 stop:7332 length:183 start_codon:yes stop_codon:yes gene_type:complete